MRWTKHTIPVLISKVGTFILFLFALGMIVGYFLAQAGYNYFILLVPVVAMAIMWYKLDEGTLVFIMLLAVAFFFPEVFAM
tara:strand:- start:7486 stop:7728 length:243 start_codon:yes stop_codon:yes gene_type:complete